MRRLLKHTYLHCSFLPLLMLLLLPGADLCSAQQLRVLVNGEEVKFDVPPVLRGGLVFVPLRGVFEQMKATVRFTKSTGEIFAQKGKHTVILRAGQDKAQVDGHITAMLFPAFILKGRAMVPLRFLSESLGCQVNWHPPSGKISITTGKIEEIKVEEPEVEIPEK